MTLGFSQTLKG